MSKYCEPCVHLLLTEKKQNLQKEKKPHFCIKFNEDVKHQDEHPLLPRLEICLAVGKKLIQER